MIWYNKMEEWHAVKGGRGQGWWGHGCKAGVVNTSSRRVCETSAMPHVLTLGWLYVWQIERGQGKADGCGLQAPKLMGGLPFWLASPDEHATLWLVSMSQLAWWHYCFEQPAALEP